ncbi:MAG: hypothetical protein H6936_17150 [Burkholderiales bacterium]|nr:hypothetical protein [Nitrosomonas sp.]MCP5276539.1 hypothetical protein [Burkholderiales bacterium]
MNKPVATPNNLLVEKRALSITQFCSAYGISRASYYNLQKSGNAPATLNVGRRRLITTDAAEAWANKMTIAVVKHGG